MRAPTIKEINDSNDLLGYMLQIQNGNHVCKTDRIYEKMGLNKDKDIKFFLAELEHENYIEIQSSDSIFITPIGRKGFKTTRKKAWDAVKPCLKTIITYIAGVISAVVAQNFEKILQFLQN